MNKPCRCAGHTRRRGSAATGSGADSFTGRIPCLRPIHKHRQDQRSHRNIGPEDYRYFSNYASVVSSPQGSRKRGKWPKGCPRFRVFR
jgi:hypothetical protein